MEIMIAFDKATGQLQFKTSAGTDLVTALFVLESVRDNIKDQMRRESAIVVPRGVGLGN